MTVRAFAIELGDGLDLALREDWTVGPMHELILGNLERLRRWEALAHGEQTVDGLRAFTRYHLGEWVEGRALPCVISVDGHIAGAVGARIDGYSGVAEAGYLDWPPP